MCASPEPSDLSPDGSVFPLPRLAWSGGPGADAEQGSRSRERNVNCGTTA